MAKWRSDTPRDKHGIHEYNPGAFGLDLAKLRAQFRFYSDRYNVPMGKD